MVENSSTPEVVDSRRMVHLVGAGPGDPDLITRRGWQLLNSCDVVMHDALVSDRLLEELPDSIRLIHCGKRPGNHRFTQKEIQQTMVKLAREGKFVVRLKGGDPSILGRGSEEASFLRRHDIAFEIVPGVTAASASAARLGVGLTDRRQASEVTLMTGHEAGEKKGERLDWHCLASCRQTLAIYMGVGTLPVFQQRLLEYGRDPATPVAVVEKATTPEESIVLGRLKDIVETVEQRDVTPPALVVIGEVLTPLLRSGEARSSSTAAG